MLGQSIEVGVAEILIRDLPREHIYPAHARTRKSAGSMTRKLSVT
jgi:hypothetical protein